MIGDDMRELINIITETEDEDENESFRVVVPAFEQRRYLSGGCYAFAIVLRKNLLKNGFAAKLFGLFDGDDCHHAFVVVDDKAYDCRGEMPLVSSVIGDGSLIGDGDIKPITVKYLNDNYGVAGSAQLYNILREMPKYLQFYA